MTEEMTCGRGLAENAKLPATLARLTGAMAGILELHMTALDLTDPRAKAEYDAYERLAGEHRKIAEQLRETADRMGASWNLPMGRHDEQAMSGPRFVQAFEDFVHSKEELRALLHETAEEDREMLAAMRGTA
jgi:hypothetical protein